MNSIYGSEFGNAIFGMLADIAGDIVLKTDRRGFIEQSSPGLSGLGIRTDGLLILPHVSDLADPRFAQGVREYVAQVLTGKSQSDCVEFPLARTNKLADYDETSPDRRQQKWFALRLRVAPGRSGDGTGALALLRSIDKPSGAGSRSSLGNSVDQLTGLGTRDSFEEDVACRIAERPLETMVMIEIDSFRSLSHRFGPSSGEEIICAFADFLIVMLGEDCSLSRLADARFAFLLRQEDPWRAREQIDTLLQTFAQLSADFAGEGPAITASAGLAALDSSVANTISYAERALILASTSGGSHAKIAEDLPHYLARERRHA